MPPDDDEPPDQPTVTGDGDATTVIPPPTVAASELAWSLDDNDGTATATPRSWRSAWVVAGVGVLCAAGAVAAIAAFGLGSETGPEAAPRTGTVESTMPPAALPPITTPAPAAAPSPPPPSTVTVTPESPPTVTVEADPPPPLSGGTDVFTICPDGHEGVVGGHTTCAFAENVRRIFFATGMANNFTAFSPVTGDAYKMTCVGGYPAYFTDGTTMISTHCYGGDNAEVVIW